MMIFWVLKSQMLCLVFFISLFYLTSAQWNTQDYMKKEHSLTKPYQSTGLTIPNWDFLGHAMVTSKYVRLTSDHQSKHGAVWNSLPIKIANWELQVEFKVHGQGKELFGDGFVIWYTKERMQYGPVFGSTDYFQGLAIVLDTYSNHNGPHNHQHPYISAMINNGSLHYDHDKDGTHTSLAGCEAKFRNLEHDTHISIRYERNTLTVSTDMENKQTWKPCFSVQGIMLPTGYHFGVSAATGDLSDNHDVISIRTFQLDLAEDDRVVEDRSKILPSASHFEPPRERTEDPGPGSWRGVKLFLVMMVCAIGIIALVVFGIMYYQKRQENSRKRFY